MKVKINSWNMVATWSWDVKENDDVCGICHSEYDHCCPNCKMPGDDCPLIWGECKHVFHLHCLMTWFQSSTNDERCPMDRTAWKTATAPS
ncbi:RING/U-box [Pilaira anomala]|nr:RING/U-box [Pilaira anomala]